ncbi:hypothetical protein [Photobacterium halotolerans]|uniref:hypothetical protein n=1 Tax=Photobacterium halotolerans TaxID=265726 RepID=UPI001372A0DB|nr:hypothetical protein [Photobacterium halotolerans]NAW86953.1 hypothetical protein [Photobacterium halotolerans]
MNKIIRVSLMASILTSCASQPQEELVLHNAWLELVAGKIEKNGGKVICANPVYQKCMNISEGMCTVEISPASNYCASDSIKRYGALSEENIEDYFVNYHSCMLFEHARLYDLDWLEPLRCMGKNANDHFDSRSFQLLFD